MKLSRLRMRSAASYRDRAVQVFQKPYRLHQEIWRLFGDTADRERDFLYRLDLHRDRPQLFTLSHRKPIDEAGLWKIETKSFEPKIRSGDLLRFSVRVNPTVKRNGKRHDVVMDAKTRLQDQGVPRTDWPTQAELIYEHCTAWLTDRAERCGFEPTSSLRAEGYQQHELKKKKHGRLIRLTTCDLEGVLRVTEPETFLAQVERGFGPAKGFGCGLMLLARAGST